MRPIVIALLLVAPTVTLADEAPDAGAPAPKLVLYFQIAQDEIDHPQPHLPNWFKNAYANEQVTARYVVCLRTDGRVGVVHSMGGLDVVDQSLMEQIRQGWTYKPQPVPVCFTALLKFQINATAPPPYRVPSFFGSKLVSPRPQPPPTVPRPVEAVYKVCFGADGSVDAASGVTKLEGPDFDDGWVRGLMKRAWRLDPSVAPACVVAPFRWTGDEPLMGVLASGPGAASRGPKMVAGFTLIRDQVQHPMPRLPEWFKDAFSNEAVHGTYKVCLRTDGTVENVTLMNKLGEVDDEVMAQIRESWTYKPQPEPVCFVAVVKFMINGNGPPAYRLASRFEGRITMPRIASALSHLDVVYKVCFRDDGSVLDVRQLAGTSFDDVDVRMQIQSRWRLDPTAAPACVVSRTRY
jgi:hypothetical protein